MSEEIKGPAKVGKKKMLENPVLASMVVPIGILLVGALIIIGVTKMLSVGRTHRDLVQEIQSKTFGNRWVAAYELSKLVATQRVPEEDLPWLIDNLSKVYESSPEARTRNFIILTFAALKHKTAVPYLEKALDDQDSQVQFNALVGIGNLPEGLSVSWDKVMKMTTSPDAGIRQVALLALAAKDVPGAETVIKTLLKDESVSVRYAAATALIQYRSPEAIPVVKDILSSETHDAFDAQKWLSIKLNVLYAIKQNKWEVFQSEIETITDKNANAKLSTKAKEVLNILKK